MDPMVFWVKITRREKFGGEIIEVMWWDRMTFDQRMRWGWYFNYRQALMQVKYPRQHVELTHGGEPAQGVDLERQLIKRIKAKKSRLFHLFSKLELAEKTWSSLFPISDDPTYQRAVVKLESKKNELAQLEHQLTVITSSNYGTDPLY